MTTHLLPIPSNWKHTASRAYTKVWEIVELKRNSLLYQISACKIVDGKLHLRGWIVDPERQLDHYSITLNGQPWITDAPLMEALAVKQQRFPTIAHADRSGFQATEPADASILAAENFAITITVKSEGETHGNVTIPMRDLSAAHQSIPLPPMDLQEHIGQMLADPEIVLSSGWRLYQDIKQQVEPYRRLSEMRHILDWGCGCGRVMRFLIQDLPAERVFGCDIDAQAIAWTRTNMPGPSCATITGQPPTPYPDSMFDLVFGVSVFTHLDEPTQFRWLSELSRITAPDGLVAVSVLGPHSTHPMHRAKIQQAGLLDQRSAQADVFTDYVGEDYYRLTYHTLEYIEREWPRYFDLVEYSIFGVNSHQDLVIMRKKHEPR